jgi:NAD(P)-dependent dehydrogenase (short-subunit alcohol dehydrogenase family)
MSEERRNARIRRSLLKMEGTVWDVAYGAVYLASDEARWVTGVILPIDGGYLAAEPRVEYPEDVAQPTSEATR